MSVAGKRAGLAGERSGLFMEQIRIIKEMRDECERRLHDAGANYNRTDIKPRYMVWENVSGAFSSNKGEDFRAVLEETAKVADKNAYVPGLEGGKWSPCGCILGNGWSIAWRLHDAQYWGVPQRRKRICLLADFNGDTAGKVLFELQRETTNRDTEQAIVDIGTESRSEVQSVSKGLSGDIAQSGKEGEGIAEDTERCAGEASKCLNSWNVRSRHIQPENQPIAFEPGAMSRVGGHAYEDVAGTVRANAGDNQQAVVYGIGSYDSNGMKSDNPHSGIYEADTSRTLDLNGGNPGCNQGGMAVVQGADVYNGELTGEKAATLTAASGASPTRSGPSVVCIEGNGQRESHKGDGYKESDTMYTLNTVEQHAVCIENHPADSRVKISENGICQTLSGRMETGGGNVPMVMERQEPIVLESNQNHATIQTNGISTTLPASMGMGGGYVPMVVEPQTFSDIASTRSAADGTKGVHSQMMKNPEENFVLEPVAMASKQISQNIGENIGMTLCGNDYKEPQCVAYGLDRASYNQGQNAQYNFSVDEEKVGTCVAKGPNAVCKAVDCLNGRGKDVNGTLATNARKSLNSGNVVRCESVVRRLTPLEAERLQGFPDHWTDIGDWIDSKGKTHKGDSDSPRYKALGNSIALPFWQWMAERMMPYLPENSTMASLFDGIGGFPLVFSRCGCKPVFSSEIEEYPIAVAKKRFGEE